MAGMQGPFQLHEGIEDRVQLGRVDAYSFVPDADDRQPGIALGAAHRQVDVAARRGELGRIDEQVADHLGQPGRIGQGIHRLLGQIEE